MAQSTWILTDRAQQTYVDHLDVTPDQAGGGATGYRVVKQRLQGGPGDGVDVVRVDNGSLRFDVLPTRGMGIWKAWLGEESIGWNSPVPGPVHPALVPLADPSGLGWLDGFDELLVRCGLESNGAPQFDEQGRVQYGLHGRIGNKPAHYVSLQIDDQTGEIAVRGVVDETRVHFFKLRLSTTIRTQIGQNWIEVCDTIQNLSASPATAQMLYHVNLGPPLLEPAARVVAPVKTLVPRNAHAARGLAHWPEYGAPQPGFEEQVYFLELQSDAQQQTAVLLENAQSTRGVKLSFNVEQLPCFTLWKNPIALADGYVTGLEPATNYPNPRSFEAEQGRIIALDGGASHAFTLRLDVLAQPAEIAEAEQQIAAISQLEPQICAAPQKGWCADA